MGYCSEFATEICGTSHGHVRNWSFIQATTAYVICINTNLTIVSCLYLHEPFLTSTVPFVNETTELIQPSLFIWRCCVWLHTTWTVSSPPLLHSGVQGLPQGVRRRHLVAQDQLWTARGHELSQRIHWWVLLKVEFVNVEKDTPVFTAPSEAPPPTFMHTHRQWDETLISTNIRIKSLE